MVVYTRTGHVLLLQRADDPEFWQSVTGSLEACEEPAQAARRELAEETGLDVPVHDCQRSAVFEIRECWRSRYPVGTTHNLEHVFLAELESIVDIRLEPEEHLAFEWVTVNEAIERLWSETNREAVKSELLPRFRA